MLAHRMQQFGTVFRLVDQFELISRTDLAKLSKIAPASITTLVKVLIDNQFLVERTAQNSSTRGRPAVGLAVSSFFWQLLSITVSPHSLSIALCELNGKQISQKQYAITAEQIPQLAEHIAHCLSIFQQHCPLVSQQVLAISISVIGRISQDKCHIIHLGEMPLHCAIVEQLSSQFSCPILLNEHFQCWLLAESSLGSLIAHDDVIFLQLDDSLNLTVLLKGALLHSHKMSVDKMLMPRFALSDEIYPELDELKRYQLENQVTVPAICRLIDRYLPNAFTQNEEKIVNLCQLIEQQDPQAVKILQHIADNLAYMLMNLINIFSTEKIMLHSPLIQVKAQLFERIKIKLQDNLLLDELHIDLVTSQYDWNSPLIACSPIKQAIYSGTLIEDIIKC